MHYGSFYYQSSSIILSCYLCLSIPHLRERMSNLCSKMALALMLQNGYQFNGCQIQISMSEDSKFTRKLWRYPPPLHPSCNWNSAKFEKKYPLINVRPLVWSVPRVAQGNASQLFSLNSQPLYHGRLFPRC